MQPSTNLPVVSNLLSFSGNAAIEGKATITGNLGVGESGAFVKNLKADLANSYSIQLLSDCCAPDGDAHIRTYAVRSSGFGYSGMHTVGYTLPPENRSS